ncbi:MAG: hypothetical protein AVDCRST_MAG93-7184 [uncultured Chloroflexia bacterium]|uniref:Uncharacterized protein n=1 Tax=uncultured Chloroflexia bacterium TaxID=1672391 RepID=A0A6J4M7X2_9CHLR|nr:MAG: hypothetical protein AVDCRST_MAG93-7184 [uncultured Chloroflexia bacterium]
MPATSQVSLADGKRAIHGRARPRPPHALQQPLQLQHLCDAAAGKKLAVIGGPGSTRTSRLMLSTPPNSGSVDRITAIRAPRHFFVNVRSEEEPVGSTKIPLFRPPLSLKLTTPIRHPARGLA